MDSLEDVFICRNCSRMFKVATKLRNLFYYSGRAIRFALTCLYSAVYFFTTTESLPLKVLDFGLQRSTGPSS